MLLQNRLDWHVQDTVWTMNIVILAHNKLYRKMQVGFTRGKVMHCIKDSRSSLAGAFQCEGL